jgi:hypothetical protein
MIDATLILEVQPIRQAPEDRAVLVWVPASLDGPSFWTFARWFTGPLEPGDDNGHRRDLIARHGGYWTSKRRRPSPLPRLPTHFVDMPGLDNDRAPRGVTLFGRPDA